jgi:hypothetical protein
VSCFFGCSLRFACWASNTRQSLGSAFYGQRPTHNGAIIKGCYPFSCVQVFVLRANHNSHGFIQESFVDRRLKRDMKSFHMDGMLKWDMESFHTNWMLRWDSEASTQGWHNLHSLHIAVQHRFTGTSTRSSSLHLHRRRSGLQEAWWMRWHSLQHTSPAHIHGNLHTIIVLFTFTIGDLGFKRHDGWCGTISSHCIGRMRGALIQDIHPHQAFQWRPQQD